MAHISRTAQRPRPGRVGLAAVLLLTIAGSACAGPTDNDTRSATAGLPDTIESLQANAWTLDRNASEPAIGSDEAISLDFGADQLSGQAPCNTYRATFTVDDDEHLDVDEIATSRRACDGDVMAAEQSYLAALAEVDLVDASSPAHLVLSGPGVELVFDVQDLDEALVAEWEIVNLATADALAGPVAGTTPTVTFGQDGSVVAGAGCNPLSATFELSGSKISISAVSATETACDDPAGVMDQEAATVAALERAYRVDITDQLTIFDDQDRMIIVADRSSK